MEFDDESRRAFVICNSDCIDWVTETWLNLQGSSKVTHWLRKTSISCRFLSWKRQRKKDLGLLNHVMTENEQWWSRAEGVTVWNILVQIIQFVMWKVLEKPGLDIRVPLRSLVFEKDGHRVELENSRESSLIQRSIKTGLGKGSRTGERRALVALCGYVRQETAGAAAGGGAGTGTKGDKLATNTARLTRRCLAGRAEKLWACLAVD